MRTQSNIPQNNEKLDATSLLSEFFDVCKKGDQFYSQVAADIENQALRNQLFEMASLRHTIANSLEPEMEKNGFDKGLTTARESSLRHWYSKAPKEFSHYENQRFLTELEQMESTYLTALKKHIATLKNQRYAIILASKAASIQMMHDNLRALKESLKETL